MLSILRLSEIKRLVCMQKFVSVKGKRVQPSPPYLKITLTFAAALLVVLILLLNLFGNVFKVVHYYGDSMKPSLKDRQILILLSTDTAEEGDIIAFYYNNKVLVRRVICEGGKTISIDDSGLVTVNGVLLDEPYVEQLSIGQSNIKFPYNVLVGQYFVMGDNRSISMDSRLSEIGTIPNDRLLGKVLFAF